MSCSKKSLTNALAKSKLNSVVYILWRLFEKGFIVSLVRQSPRAIAKRTQILNAARRLFPERGFERTSMEAIRELAGVSKPTLYNHFSSKEALFAGVLTQLIDDLTEEWLPAIAYERSLATQDDLQKALLELTQKALTSFMRTEYLALVRVVIAETARFPQLGEILRTAGPERALQAVTTLLERAREDGASIDDIDAAARLLVGSITMYVLADGLLVASDVPRLPEPERIAAIVELFVKAIRYS